MSGGGRKRRGHEEEHENHERWLVTYADMLTVLMALFIVMFALSVVDKAKFEEFKLGLQGELGAGASLLDGGQGLQPEPGDSMTIDVEAAVAALEEKQAREAAVVQEADDLRAAREKILAALVARGMQDSVEFEVDERGLVVTVVTDDVLFELGSATLQPKGRAVLDAIAPALTALPNPVTVEGHTDDLPISGGRFASNWELSTERATSVLRYVLERHRLPAARLSAAGYADQRPLGPNTPTGRSSNRRVEVVVRATAVPPAAVPDLAVRPATAVAPAAGGTRTGGATDAPDSTDHGAAAATTPGKEH
jgi:chemotaxis protein MotB